MQRPPAYSAVKVGGERAYKKARGGEAVEGEPRPVTVHRFELLWREGERAGLEIECSRGHLRAPAWWPTSATPTARSSSAPRSARSGWRTPTPSGWCRPRRRSRSCRSARSTPRRPRPVAHGRARAGGRGRTGPVRLTHDGALLAHRRAAAAGELQPVVVFAA